MHFIIWSSYHCCISVGLDFDSYIQVLDIKIFKGHALHIIVVYQWVVSLTLIYKYKVLGILKGHALHISGPCLFIQVYKSYIKELVIRYFQRPYASYLCHISLGLVFCSFIQILGIRSFQRPCASYCCGISCILVWSCLLLLYIILGIRYFQWPCILYHCCIHIYTYVFHLLKPVSMKLSTCKIVELIRIHYWTWYLIPNTLIHWAENIKSLPRNCPRVQI